MGVSRRRTARAGLVLAGCAIGSVALAQESAREAASALEEIVVTAQKREESMQSVPIAVTALDAKMIENTYSRDIQDVESLAPNLIVDPILGNGTAAISIRGMQLNDVEKSFDPAVAVYLDGVYLSNTTGALIQMNDAEAVEVLRGPQGTLFGRNTIGGLIHVRRARPTGEFGGNMALNLGKYDQVDARATMNFPAIFGDRLSTKISLYSQEGGGYFYNTSRNTDEGDADYKALVASALFEATDNLEFLLTVDWIDDNTPTRPVTALTAVGEVFCPFAGAPGCGRPKSDAEYHRKPTTTLDQEAFLDTLALTLNATWQMSDAHRFVSVTGWRDYDENALQEFDGTAGDVFWTYRPTESDQFSEELRWEADWSDRIRSTLGLYYWKSSYELNQQTFSPAFFPPPTGIDNSARNFRQDTTAYAAFGQIDWDITDAFSVSIGGRYSNEEKEACGTEYLNLTGVGVVPIISYGNCTERPNYSSSYVDPITGETVSGIDGEESWSDFTPRFGVSYDVSDSKMVYATWSEGFRSGGFNGRASGPGSLGPYDPEKVETIEIGAKTQWLDDRLRFNVAAFTTDYTDKQEDVVFPDPVAVTVTVVQNASSATIKGAEFEFTAVPMEGLTVGANLGLLDTEFDDWKVPGLTGGTVDKSDFELRRAPEYTFGVNTQYEQRLDSGNFLVYGLNYAYKDDYYIIANTVSHDSTEPGKVEGYGLLDASISYETEVWSISLWGKNLTDEDYFMHVLDVGTNYLAGPGQEAIVVPGLWTFGTMSPPRTYGVEFRFNF
jgi:iron complex outermembrane receptor protein